jgi:hypothetical protein
MNHMSTDVKPPEEQLDSPPTQPDFSQSILSEGAAKDSLDQVKQVATQVFGRLGEAPDYLAGIFSEYKRPLTVIGLVLGALIAVKVTFAVLGAINDIPVLAPSLELIGLIYSGWFVYRYLLKAETRRELINTLNTTKDQVIGKHS